MTGFSAVGTGSPPAIAIFPASRGLLGQYTRSNHNRIIQMAVERTLSIIKPDAVANNVIGQIYTRFEQAGLKIVASRMTHLTDKEAGGFYAAHSARGFFKDLVCVHGQRPGRDPGAGRRETRSPSTATSWAPPIRRKPRRAPSAPTSPTSIDENAVHGSDSTEAAATEIAYFFRATELAPRTR
jgi:nucleoside-diphosphate kinase